MCQICWFKRCCFTLNFLVIRHCTSVQNMAAFTYSCNKTTSNSRKKRLFCSFTVRKIWLIYFYVHSCLRNCSFTIFPTFRVQTTSDRQLYPNQPQCLCSTKYDGIFKKVFNIFIIFTAATVAGGSVATYSNFI